MKNKKKNAWLKYVIICFVVIWAIFFSTDYIRAQNDQRPIFALSFSFCKHSDASKTYIGIGYKVIEYVDMVIGEDGFVRIFPNRIDIGTYFMPFQK